MYNFSGFNEIWTSKNLGIQGGRWHKKSAKQYRIFEPRLSIMLVNVGFWSTEFFGGLKDEIKQTTQVNDNNNPLF